MIRLGHRAAAMIASMQTVDPGVSILADPDTESARRRLLLSAAMCLPARESARTKTFQPV